MPDFSQVRPTLAIYLAERMLYDKYGRVLTGARIETTWKEAFQNAQ